MQTIQSNGHKGEISEIQRNVYIHTIWSNGYKGEISVIYIHTMWSNGYKGEISEMQRNVYIQTKWSTGYKGETSEKHRSRKGEEGKEDISFDTLMGRRSSGKLSSNKWRCTNIQTGCVSFGNRMFMRKNKKNVAINASTKSKPGLNVRPSTHG
jgi:hypothetical protein